MPTIIYGKLVRDAIPAQIVRNGDTCITRVLDDAEYRDALQEKLKEETEELVASSGEERLEEMADIFEVLWALAKAEGYSEYDLLEAVRKKKLARGGFDERIWLVSTKTGECERPAMP